MYRLKMTSGVVVMDILALIILYKCVHAKDDADHADADHLQTTFNTPLLTDNEIFEAR